jgi:hypothetical protein
VAVTAAWGAGILLLFGLCTLWVRDRWAVAAFQSGFLLLGLLLLGWRAIRPYPLFTNACLWPLGGIAVWAGAQIALGITVQKSVTWEAMTEFAVHLVAAWVMVQAVSSPTVRSALVRVWLWGSAILAAQALLQVLSGDGRAFWTFDTGYASEVLGPFVYKNKFAQFAELLMPLALCRALVGGPKARIYLVPAAVLFSAVVASGSRAGVALLIVELFVLLVLCWRRGVISAKQAALLGFGSTAMFALWGFLAGWDLLFERLLTIDPLSDHRWPIMWSSSQMAREHIWTGFGMGCWPLVYPGYASFDIGVVVNQAHCDWLQWLGEGGLPMFILMSWLLAGLARRGWRRIWGIGLVFVMIHAMIDYPFHQLPAFFTFVLLTAILAGSEGEVERNRGGREIA